MRRWQIWPQENYKEIELFLYLGISLKAVVSKIMPARPTRNPPSLPLLCVNVIISREWWRGKCGLWKQIPGLETQLCQLTSCMQPWSSSSAGYSNHICVLFVVSSTLNNICKVI